MFQKFHLTKLITTYILNLDSRSRCKVDAPQNNLVLKGLESLEGLDGLEQAVYKFL